MAESRRTKLSSETTESRLLSHVNAFANPVRPRYYQRPRAKGTWLAKEEEPKIKAVIVESRPDPAERWNRRGTTNSSFAFATYRRGGLRPQSAPSVGRPGTAGSSSKRRPQSAWSDATTAGPEQSRAETPGLYTEEGRETPMPGMFEEDEGAIKPMYTEHEIAGAAIHKFEAGFKNPMKEHRTESKESESPEVRRAREKQRDKEMKWLLMKRRKLDENEYARLVLDTMKPRTRSKSWYESCLLPERVRPHPEQVAYHDVNKRLDEDREAYDDKYREDMGTKMEQLREDMVTKCKTAEHSTTLSAAWKVPSNKYNISLPSGSQHDKFTRLDELSNTDEQKLKKNDAPRFAIHTLRNWFHAIDTEQKGMLTRRQMLNALWYHKDLLDIFTRCVGLTREKLQRVSQTSEVLRSLDSAKFDDIDEDLAEAFGTRDSQNTFGTMQSETFEVFQEEEIHQANVKANELRAIALILRDLDKENGKKDGLISWEELVDFFRRNGSLLEFETEEGIKQNDATHFYVEKGIESMGAGSLQFTKSPSSAAKAAKGQFQTFGALQGRGETQKRRDSLRRENTWTSNPGASSPLSVRRSGSIKLSDDQSVDDESES